MLTQSLKAYFRGSACSPFSSKKTRRLQKMAASTVVEKLDVRVLLSAGDPDPTFGNGDIGNTFIDATGLVITDLSGADVVQDLIVQSDDKIVAVGYGGAGSPDFALTRYNEDGTLDTSFGDEGRVLTDFGGNDFAFGAVLQSDGKIVVVGETDLEGIKSFALARYNVDGSLDTSFNLADDDLSAVDSPGPV